MSPTAHKTPAEFMAGYARIRRGYFPPVAKKPINPKAVYAAPVLLVMIDQPYEAAGQIKHSDKPSWKVSDLTFNAHVLEWRKYMVSIGKGKAVPFMRYWCKIHEVKFDDVIGTSRKKTLVFYRHHLMAELRRRFKLSYPQIAKLFGGRNHTSVVHAVERVAAMKGANA